MHGCLSQRLYAILTSPDFFSRDFFIQKINLIKQLKNLDDFSQKSHSKYKLFNMFGFAIKANAKTFLSQNMDFEKETENEISFNEWINKAISLYLETILNKYPKSSLVKLHLAYHYTKKVHMRSKAVNLLLQFQKKFSSKIRLNSELLLFDIQRSIESENKEKRS